MKFAFKIVDIFVRFATSLLTIELNLFFLFAYILPRFVQEVVGYIAGLLSCLRISDKLWLQIFFLDCSDQKYNVGV
jgi:hypothetical protein